MMSRPEITEPKKIQSARYEKTVAYVQYYDGTTDVIPLDKHVGNKLARKDSYAIPCQFLCKLAPTNLNSGENCKNKSTGAIHAHPCVPGQFFYFNKTLERVRYVKKLREHQRTGS
ncbi:hypothetical protein FACS189421_06900 [Bacteroidia bacterium]|nr:hypothetical protein FACS189421_06900 [Bacteroidia bacterium]